MTGPHDEGRDDLPTEDDNEDFDATDTGDDVVPDGTDAILFAQMLVDLRDAGFPEDPDDPDGSNMVGR